MDNDSYEFQLIIGQKSDGSCDLLMLVNDKRYKIDVRSEQFKRDAPEMYETISIMIKSLRTTVNKNIEDNESGDGQTFKFCKN